MSTCRHCGQRIVLADTYWTHADSDLVRCGNGETQAEPSR